MTSDLGMALRALDRAGGDRLTRALRMGYAAAARVVRDRAKQTTAFKDRTGTARKSWRVSQSSRPFNHAKVVNTATTMVNGRAFPYALFLERKPLESGFMERAARATGKEQLDAVRKAVLRHLRKLRTAPK